ncbi:MAG: glycosyltransferase family 4 protein [Thermoanaerobaculia bacterium]|nr:glycosyltransferase family 4 protein [Thermoanaerobaculia bacterium]
MRIAYIAAGAGTMLCGSCIRDNALVTALQRRGHEALLLPIYTPLRTDEESVADRDHMFYGAVNIYLQQKLPILARMPRGLHALLDRPGLLKRISTSTNLTNAKGLGELTLSMLMGEEGRQAKELEDLADWLADEYRPELVHLTNAMLLGLADRLKERLGVPIVCSLQGEDIFLDDLTPDYRAKVLAILREKATHVDSLVATSRYYADHMASYLELPRERIQVARIGINLEGHGGEPAARSGGGAVGYMARICPEKGLHVLVEAFGEVAASRPGARLDVAGYLGGRDRGYYREVAARASAAPWGDRFRYLGEIDRAAKVAFLSGLDVLSVPTVYREAKGLFVLEALANAVPVVLPDHGTFSEVVADTGGGLLVEPGSAAALAEGIGRLLDDHDLRDELGARGRAAVAARWGAEAMAVETEAIYRRLLSGTSAAEREVAALETSA